MNNVQKFFAIKLCRYVKRNQVDIIHSNSSVIDIGMYVAEKTNVKHIWHFREYGLADYNLIYLRGRKKSIELINKTKKVIFISKALRESYGDIDEKCSCVIYNGVSDKHRINEKVHNSELVFLVTGNISATKNQLVLLRAVELLKRKGIIDFSVKIAGESTDLQQSKLYKRELVDFIQQHNLHNVEMLGYISDIKEVRKTADVEIVASVSEAFGRVTVEGMMARNPVIVSNAGANTELVMDGKNGLIFESNNPQALADKMEYLVFNIDKVSEMGEFAYTYAVENFTIEKCAENIESLYKRIL